MRKIAANYIFLPGSSLVKNGYVILEGKQVREIVDTGGKIREIPALEFYGGMLVADFLAGTDLKGKEGQALLPYLENRYRGLSWEKGGISLLKGADLVELTFGKNTEIERVV